ncbi:MAG: serine/threonine protein kinase, partial [Myxococcales bacterium]|nr:serine/threonine protein kinase [Myxococcales bacterium]
MARLDDLDPAIAPTLGGGDPAPIDSLDEVPASIDDDLARLVRAPSVRPPPGRGAEIGRYLVLDKVGEGGIGVVLSAYDPQLDRKVAIKLLRRDRRQAASTGGRERALTEARALARLVHPHIVAVHDAGLLDDEIYVVMELVDGTDLRGWLDAGSRVRDEILDVFVQAGEGLAAAHDAGLVHRDFKPDNVLVGKDGRVRVADFGLARVLDAGTPSGAPDDRDAASAGPVDLTVTGAFVGTPAYMAPEQIDAGRVDAAADVFAYCASLWEALFAARPFEAPTLGER